MNLTMDRYKDNRFCEYVYASTDVWVKDGDALIEVWPEDDSKKPYHVHRKWLTESPVNFGCSY